MLDTHWQCGSGGEVAEWVVPAGAWIARTDLAQKQTRLKEPALSMLVCAELLPCFPS